MKRKFTTVVSLLMIVVLISAGTFAWVNYSQSILNEFQGGGDGKIGGGNSSVGGTTHDDFDEETGQKDIYVENWGDTPIYVRIRLDEYMEVGEGAGLKKIHVGDGIYEPDPDNKSVPLTPGSDINNTDTWTPHVPYNQTVEICNTPAKFHDYWEWEMGGGKIYKAAPEDERKKPGYIDQNKNIYPNLGADINLDETLNALVITMAQWIALGQPIGTYWVIDVDGWAYWAAPIYTGDATGLLLNSVTPIYEFEDSYYYAINVLVQMATKLGDLNYRNFYDGSDDDHQATDDGKELLEIITGGEGTEIKIPAVEIKFDGRDKTIDVGEQYVPGYIITPTNSTSEVTWSSDDPDIALVDSYGKITGVAEGTANITISANGKTDVIAITVQKSTDPKIPTENGEGPYDTKVSDTNPEANYALKRQIKNGEVQSNPGLDQNGSIKLSDIVTGADYDGIGIKAADSKYEGYFYIGTDKDGDAAIIYTFIPEIDVWENAYPNIPVIDGVQLLLTKAGYQDTLIKVTLRYNGSLFSE